MAYVYDNDFRLGDIMGNTFYTTTNLWVVDSTGDLNTTPVVVMAVIYVPGDVDHDLIISDTSDNPAIVLKAGATDASPICFNFHPYGREYLNLKCHTIDGGTAYIYLKDKRLLHM